MVERILEIIKINKLTAARFAEILDVQRSNVSHVLSGRNNPSLDFVIKVLNAFPEISSEWLLFGKGNMLKDERKKFVSSYDLFSETEMKTDDQKQNKTTIETQQDNKSTPVSTSEKDKTVTTTLSSDEPAKKYISKILFLYNDRSFEVYDQNNQ